MDKPKFANLLSRYDYTLEDIDYNVLETNPNSNNEITDDPGTSFCRFRTLHTDDIDQVAHWLGNPDQLYERNILETTTVKP